MSDDPQRPDHQQYPDSQNPFSYSASANSLPPQMQEKPRGGSPWKIVIIILGIIVAIAISCCLCAIGVFYFSTQQIAQLAKEQYADNPVIEEHIGELEQVSFNLWATSEETQARGENVLVFDVSGDKGSGKLIVEQRPGGDPDTPFQNGVLVTDDGEFELSD